MSIENLISSIENYEDLENKLKWEGTLKDYLYLLSSNPSLHMNAHKRVLKMIESYGIERDSEGKIISYNFFDNDLFGVSDSIEEIMSYLRAAAAESEVSRRILLLYGPTSSGKSQLAILLKRGLEQFSKTDEGAIFRLADSAMHEDPLTAIPHSLRPEIEQKLGIKIHGELSPLMNVILKEKYNNKFLDLKVERYFFSEKDRNSIGTFVPSDKKSQDISELIGSMDLSSIGTYGSESDPRAWKFDGELNIANRGLMEFVEMLKVDQKFLYVLLTLAQEKNIKTGRFPLIYADEFILSHSNETEYNRFLGKDEMEALHDRTIVVKFPYNLSVNEEIKIYEKLIAASNLNNIHIAPHTLRAAAIFAILSRLKESSNVGLTLMSKLRLYNGENVEGFTLEEVPKFKSEFTNEGMEGISPRYVINRISARLADGASFVTPVDIIRSLKEGLRSNPKIKKDEIAKYEHIFTYVIEEYNKLAQNDVQKAFFVNFEDEITNLLQNYMDNIEAYLEGKKIQNDWGDYIDPNERLMRSIEEKIQITESGKKSFRQEIYRKMLRSLKENGFYDYKNHPKLREALEKQLFDERRDVVRMTVSSRNPDEKELRRINQVIDLLCEKYGYTAESANQLLRYVNSLMARN